MFSHQRQQSLSKHALQKINNPSTIHKLHGSFQQLYQLLSRQTNKPNLHKSTSKCVTKGSNKSSPQKAKMQYTVEMKRKDHRIDFILKDPNRSSLDMQKCQSQVQSVISSKKNTTEVKKEHTGAVSTTQEGLKKIIFGNEDKSKKIYLTSKNSLREVSYQSFKSFNRQSKLLSKHRSVTQNTPQKRKLNEDIQTAKNHLKKLTEKTSLACYLKEASPKLRKQGPIQKEPHRLRLKRHSKKISVRGDHVTNCPKSKDKLKETERASYQNIYRKKANSSAVSKQPLGDAIIPIQIKKGQRTSLDSLLIHYCEPKFINEYVLAKMIHWIQFCQLLLSTFHCKLSFPLEPSSLPKYSRKNTFSTFYVGPGNNRNLLLQTFSKRWWWREVDNIEEANFVWTQIKIDQLLVLKQEKGSGQKKESKDDRSSKLSQQSLRKSSNLHKLLQSYKQSYGSQYNVPIKYISSPKSLHNHLINSGILGNKKSLFSLLKNWIIDYKGLGVHSLFDIIPQTYHIVSEGSESFRQFELKYTIENPSQQNIWIVKPGQNSNRGRDIFISNSFEQISEAVRTRSYAQGTTIIQRYKSNLLLYQGRKFDIRTFMLCLFIGGKCKFYWFSLGYIRTCSHQFNLDSMSSMIHLTNDAIQIQGQKYGKYEKGNKLSYHQLQSYLKGVFPQKEWKIDSLVEQMKDIAKVLAQASYSLIEQSDKEFGFELFGLDFIVDNEFKPWLLEVNTNPCLELSSPLLQTLLPSLIENVFRLAVDPLYPPTMLPDKERQYSIPDKIVESNKFEQLFDSETERDQQWETFCLESQLTQ